MEVEVRSAGCLSIHLTPQSSHLPLSEGFIMRGGPGRGLSKGGKDGKASWKKRAAVAQLCLEVVNIFWVEEFLQRCKYPYIVSIGLID